MQYSYMVENHVDDLADVARLHRVRLDHAAGTAVEGGRGASSFPDTGAQKRGQGSELFTRTGVI